MIGRLNTGQIVSGIGHVGLIGWALFGGLFSAEPLPFEVTEVTAISEEEFAALFPPEENPSAVSDVVTPNAPEVDEAAPDVAATPDAPPETTQPEASETAEPDAVPDAPQPAPEAEVTDEPPVLDPPSEDVAVLLPERDARPQPRPAPRVAPEPVAQPEPDVRIDDVPQEETTPSEDAETQREDTEAAAQEEATTEIVTEAEQAAAAAPSRSVRPKTRPQRTAAAEPQDPEEPAQDQSDAVNDALAEALGSGGADTTPEPTGPPLTRGEKDALRVAVERCWNVGSLSSDALQTTVVVSVEMSEDGKPVNSSIRMLSSSGGSAASARQAYEAARRAIIRCGSSGFSLPAEKYSRWREIEMTFNPEKMRIK